MTEPQPKKSTFPIPPALLAIDFAAMVTLGLCLAELLPRRGKQPPGLIPADFAWPLLAVSAVVAAVCGVLVVRALLNRKKSVQAENENHLPVG